MLVAKSHTVTALVVAVEIMQTATAAFLDFGSWPMDFENYLSCSVSQWNLGLLESSGRKAVPNHDIAAVMVNCI